MEEQFCIDYVTVLRAWAASERRFPVIDVDFAPSSSPSDELSLKNTAILDELIRLKCQCDSPIICRRLQAHISFLEESMGKAEPFNAMIRTAYGFEPFMFAETAIEQQKAHIEQLSQDAGIHRMQHPLDEISGVVPLQNTELESTVYAMTDRLLATMSAMLGRSLELPFNVTVVNEQAYWSCWADGDSRTGFRLRINVHQREYPLYKLAYYVFHEVFGHMLQIECLRAIDHGIHAITTLHSPEQFVAEGIAQTSYWFMGPICEMVDPHLNVFLEQKCLKLMILNNLHKMIYDCISNDELSQYATTHGLGERQVREEIDSRRNDPQFRRYQYVYPASMVYFRNILRDCPMVNRPSTYMRLLSTPLDFVSMEVERKNTGIPPFEFGKEMPPVG